MKDEYFKRGKAPMTKMEIRNTIISYLELDHANKLLDIGAGTGSVCIAIAKQYPQVAVTAVEKDLESCELIRENIQKHGAKVDVICAKVPDALSRLKRFDRVYIGGSGGDITKVIQWLESTCFQQGTLIVCSFITLENLNQFFSYVTANEKQYTNIEGSHIQASRLEKLGGYHYFKPSNGCYVIKCVYGG